MRSNHKLFKSFRLLSIVAMFPLVYGTTWLEAAINSPGQATVYHAIAATAQSTLKFDILSDAEAQQDAMLQEFWLWAWGASYIQGSSYIEIEAAGGSNWTAYAYQLNRSGEPFVVGSGQLQVSIWIDEMSDSLTEVDPGTGELLEQSFLFSILSANFIASSGQNRPIFAGAVQTRLKTVNSTQLDQSTVVLIPFLLATSMAEASSSAMSLDSAINDPAGLQSPSSLTLTESSLTIDGGSVMAQGGGTLPCDVDNPSCECECASAASLCRHTANLAFIQGVFTCFGASIFVGIVCGVACLTPQPLQPITCGACLGLMGQALAACILGVFALWTLLQLQCALEETVCVLDCGGFVTPTP